MCRLIVSMSFQHWVVPLDNWGMTLHMEYPRAGVLQRASSLQTPIIQPVVLPVGLGTDLCAVYIMHLRPACESHATHVVPGPMYYMWCVGLEPVHTACRVSLRHTHAPCSIGGQTGSMC